jgi:hypothetical protein
MLNAKNSAGDVLWPVSDPYRYASLIKMKNVQVVVAGGGSCLSGWDVRKVRHADIAGAWRDRASGEIRLDAGGRFACMPILVFRSNFPPAQKSVSRNRDFWLESSFVAETS